MDLNEIETKADELLAQMYKELPGPAGAAEMRDICTRMDALERAARIKALNASRAGRCSHRWQWREGEGGLVVPHFEVCTLPENHAGSHRNEVTGVSAVATEPTGATGPLAEVRALIAMWNGYSRNQDGRAADQLLEDGDRRYAAGQSVAWGKAASILQEVMQKEGLL